MVQSKHFVAFFLAAAATANVAALPTPASSQEIKHHDPTIEPAWYTDLGPPGRTSLEELQKIDNSKPTMTPEQHAEARDKRTGGWVDVVKEEHAKAHAKLDALDKAYAKEQLKPAEARNKRILTWIDVSKKALAKARHDEAQGQAPQAHAPAPRAHSPGSHDGKDKS